MKRPNFFIVGAPRCGTTAMYDFLKWHPDIFLPEYKEPFFFCRDFHRESDRYYGKKVYFPFRTEKQYMQLFKNTRNENAVGEITPEYLYSKEAAIRIKKFNPDTRIIIVLREPVEFLYSLHSQFYFFSGENIREFSKALEAEKDRRKGRRIPPGVRWPSALYYSERALFYEQVKRFTDNFEPSQIMIYLFEDFKKDNRGIYLEILDFLGLDKTYIPDFRPTNENKVLDNRLINGLFNRLSDSSLKKILPLKTRVKAGNLIQSFFMKKAPRKQMDAALKNKLRHQLKPDIERLDKHLREKDLIKHSLLKRWGYEET